MSRITEALAKVNGAPPDQPYQAETTTWDFGSTAASSPASSAASSIDALPTEKEQPRVAARPQPAPRADARPPVRPIQPGPGYEERLFIDSRMPRAVVEQYGRLGAVLHRAQVDSGIRSVMVASSIPGEGKTLVASNLALVLSRSYGRRVLLVDGDLRRPSIHHAFGVENVGGIADRLGASQPGPLAPVRLGETLDLLVAGSTQGDPLRIVTSPAMRTLLQDGQAEYDWVILDTPPIALMPDAHLLASMVDRVLLVIDAGRTPYDLTQKSVERLGKERIIGSILNRAIVPASAAYAKEYDRYYGGRD